jgi:hypothetical protein
MVEKRFDGRQSGSSRAGPSARRSPRLKAGGGTVLGPHPEVAGAENHSRERVHLLCSQRGAAGEPDFNPRAARRVHALQARRQRRGVVRHHKISRPQIIDEPRSRRVSDLPLRVDDEQPGAARALDRSIGGNHRRVSPTSGSDSPEGLGKATRSALRA